MKPVFYFITLLLTTALTSLPAAADVAEELPTKIDASKSWVFYAHGSAVYKKNKTIGWKKKTSALSSKGYKIITEERFDLDEEAAYAQKVVGQINKLLSSGVPANNIYIGGFSRGATISLDVATRLVNPGLNYFLIAGCKQDGDSIDAVQGRFLSLYATDDEKEYGSCKQFLEGKSGAKLTEKSYPDKGHKYFSGINNAWLGPLFKWMKTTNK